MIAPHRATFILAAVQRFTKATKWIKIARYRNDRSRSMDRRIEANHHISGPAPKEAGISNGVNSFGTTITTLGVCLGHPVHRAQFRPSHHYRVARRSPILHDNSGVFGLSTFEAYAYHSLNHQARHVSESQFHRQSGLRNEIMGVRHRI